MVSYPPLLLDFLFVSKCLFNGKTQLLSVKRHATFNHISVRKRMMEDILYCATKIQISARLVGKSKSVDPN